YSRRWHTISKRYCSSDVCYSDLKVQSHWQTYGGVLREPVMRYDHKYDQSSRAGCIRRQTRQYWVPDRWTAERGVPLKYPTQSGLRCPGDRTNRLYQALFGAVAPSPPRRLRFD